MPIQYVTIEDCTERCFPYIRNHLHIESVPSYEENDEGKKILESILSFVQNDEYYRSFAEKAAYLFCSIANRHAFPNGNKRLAATILRYFLSDNNVKTIQISAELWAKVVLELFPSYEWKAIDVDDGFYVLLYNLAFIAADGQLRPGMDYEECKFLLSSLFEKIFEISETQ